MSGELSHCLHSIDRDNFTYYLWLIGAFKKTLEVRGKFVLMCALNVYGEWRYGSTPS